MQYLVERADFHPARRCRTFRRHAALPAHQYAAMNRRRFLGATVAGAAVLGLPGALWAQSSPFPAILAQPDLIALLGRDRVRDIGIHYRTTFPHESSAAVLSETILDQLQPSDPLPASLTQQIQDDFAAGRTVLADGWVLAVTEARQCALFSLIHA